MKKVSILKMCVILFLCLNLAVPPGLPAQADKAQAAQEDAGAPAFRPEEIDQLVAPIALYPDSLLAQTLVAATYPLEVVQAARFVKQNKELKGEKLMAAAKDKEWEPSVKAMLEFPDVLLMMDEKIDWTQKLGDAFLDQQRDVMDAVQRLRKKASDSGNLKTSKEQKVTVEQVTKVIVIEPADPQVVYVPAYNPTVVYGAWPYPAYPPYPVYPPGYVAGAALFSFGVGVMVGAAWSGHGSYHCGWGSNEININTTRQNNFTKNNYNNPQKYQNSNKNWQHNPEHRQGAPHKNQATAQRYGQQRSGGGASPNSSGARGYSGSGAGRAQAQAGGMSSGGGRESTFSGAGVGGSERASSNRGQQSLSASSQSGGASRSSGGGSRGGGGGRGGRR